MHVPEIYLHPQSLAISQVASLTHPGIICSSSHAHFESVEIISPIHTVRLSSKPLCSLSDRRCGIDTLDILSNGMCGIDTLHVLSTGKCGIDIFHILSNGKHGIDTHHILSKRKHGIDTHHIVSNRKYGIDNLCIVAIPRQLLDGRKNVCVCVCV